MVEEIRDASYLEAGRRGIRELEAAAHILAKAGYETQEPRARICGDSAPEYDGPTASMCVAPEGVEDRGENEGMLDMQVCAELLYRPGEDAIDVRVGNASFATPTGRVDASEDEMIYALAETAEKVHGRTYDPNSHDTRRDFVREVFGEEEYEYLIEHREELEAVRDMLTTREDILDEMSEKGEFKKHATESVREEFRDGFFDTAAVIPSDRIAAEIERTLVDRGVSVLVGTTPHGERNKKTSESTNPRNTPI